MNLQSSELPRIWWSEPTLAPEQDCACADAAVAPLWRQSDLAAAAVTDCACADAPLAVSRTEGRDDRRLWQVASEIYVAPLPDHHSLFFHPLHSAGVVVLNRPARAALERYRQPRPLDADPLARRLAALHLLQPAAARPSPEWLPPTTLTAWLHLTAACNLRCSYCYAPRSRAHMDEATGRAAIHALVASASRHGMATLKLKYAGGEPTLRFELVQRLHDVAARAAAANGLSLQEVLLSNGTLLTPSRLAFLREAGIRLMISLDGLGVEHDAQRPFADGRGSSAFVRDGIERALAAGVVPHLSITITSATVDAVGDVVDFALERGLTFNLNFYRQPGEGGPDLRAESARLIASLRAVLQRIEARPDARVPLLPLLDRADFSVPHRHACGVGNNYVVIDPRGRIALCHMLLGRAVGDVFAGDVLDQARGDRQTLPNLPVDERADCHACPWRYACAGGCPLLARRAHGSWNGRSPYCDVYRAVFPDLLRLEGLRLLSTPGVAA